MTKPNFTLSEALNIAQSQFDISGSIRELHGYEDQNFHILTDNEKEFVLKIAKSGENREFLDVQNEALSYLSHISEVKVPIIYADTNGQKISTFTREDGKKNFVRLISFLPGTVLVNIEDQNFELLRLIGKKLGIFTKNLGNFSHPSAHRDFKWDLSRASEVIEEKIGFIDDLENKVLVKKVIKLFKSHVIPELDNLRSSIIHNDWNDYNIIINKVLDSEEVELGIIDFGDINYGKTVFELAIALSYLMMNKEDPLLYAFHVVKGFHETFPLSDLELKVLHPLIRARLCMSICNSAYQRNLDPKNEYISISAKPGWILLRKLEKYPLQFAYQTFLDACHPGLSKREIMNLRKQYIGPSLSISYQNPLKITRGFMQYLYDDEGNRYLDCVNNIPHVGHSNPEIVEVINRQASVLNTNTRYLHELIVQYAKRLCETLPESLSVCYFVNSGSEANELALRLANNYTKQRDLIVVEGGYHGNTQSLIDISSYKFDEKGGSGPPSHVHKVPLPDTYRGQYKRDNPQAGEKYADYVRETINILNHEGKKLTGFISESIMSSGGQIIFPEGYLNQVYRYVRDLGGVCIADEVQVGFGRVGTHFWGFETQGVIPDIVTIGKPMANGHPMGAVITTREIADAFNSGVEFFSSFGGNPVSCAIGLKVLEIIENDHLQENALILGNYLIKGFERLKGRYSIIGDVRGVGLFIGIELVLDHNSLEPAKILAKNIVENIKDDGILLSVDGTLKNVIKIKPPLVFNKENADTLLQIFDQNLLKFQQ